MKELREQKSGYTRVIQPFDDDPDVKVTMLKLSTAEQGKIWDYCGIRIGAPEKNTYMKWDKANQMTVRQQVQGWEGFVDHDQPVPCNDETKLRILEARFRHVGEDGESRRVPLWQILNDKFEKAEEEEEKN